MASDIQTQGSGNQILIWVAVTIVVLGIVYVML
jgi:hypothetical protein